MVAEKKPVAKKAVVISPELGIVKALYKFQQACPAIRKDSTAGTKFKYKYGSLPHILEQIKPHMKSAGLVFTQPIMWRDGNEYVITTIWDTETGGSLVSEMILPDIAFDSMNIVQSKGAIITYMRRYAIMSILGIVAEEDDTDASGSTSKKTQTKPAEKAQVIDQKPWINKMVAGKISETWTKAVQFLADNGTMEDIKKKYKISKLNEDKLMNEALAVDENRVINPADVDNPNLGFDDQGNFNS